MAALVASLTAGVQLSADTLEDNKQATELKPVHGPDSKHHSGHRE